PGSRIRRIESATVARAPALSSAGTESSRSSTTQSAPEASALSTQAGLCPGTNRIERYGCMSVTPGQPEHVLGRVVEHHLLADPRDPHEPRLAEVPLDVELLAVAEPAVGLQRGVGGEEAGLGAQVLRGVRLPPARQPAVEQPGGVLRHLPRGVQLDPGLGERERDALVLPDRAAEHLALPGVLHTPAQGGLADAERGVGADHALGVEPAEQGAEPAADL